VATPNYSYEKRQRELAKKRKLEEKKQRKLHKHDDAGPEGAPAGDATAEGAPPAEPGAAPAAD
jgi:hypothetical protein